VRYPGYKVIWKPGENGDEADYYDLQRDPGEVEAQSGMEERTAAALAVLREHDRDSKARRTELAAAAGQAPWAASVPLSPATVEQLRALGYEGAPQ